MRATVPDEANRTVFETHDVDYKDIHIEFYSYHNTNYDSDEYAAMVWEGEKRVVRICGSVKEDIRGQYEKLVGEMEDLKREREETEVVI